MSKIKIACFGGWVCDCIDKTKCDCEEEILEPWDGKVRDLPSSNKKKKMIELIFQNGFDDSVSLCCDYAIFPDDRDLLSLERYTFSKTQQTVYFRGYSGFYVYSPRIGFIECGPTEYSQNNHYNNSLKCISIRVS